jgi:hypothetical protein
MGGLQADLSNGLEKIGLSSKMANILSGASLFASVFGRAAPVVTDQGVTGTLSGAGFEGTAYADVLEKGGWLRSDKRYTLTSEADSEIAQLLTDSAASVLDQTEAYAAALGLGTSTLADVSTSIRVSLGTDTEANKTALLNAMTGYADDLAAGYSDTLAQLATYGESASDTLTRVGESLTSVNDILQTLGQQALAASVDGAANAIALQDAFGGADAYTTAAGTYLQAFYSDIERAALLRAQVAEELQAVGITTLPASKAAYRELVDAQDLTTESGRTAYATLLTLSSAFDTLSQSVETATSALADEIARLRGETTSSTGASLVALQAQFATSTAAARAGDATALAGLPELSQAIDEAAAASASSALDLQRMRAWLASSLEGTTAAVGSYTADTALTSAADTAAATASSAALAADQLAELQALREQTAQLVSAQATSAAQLTALTRLIDRLSEGGDALRTTTA